MKHINNNAGFSLIEVILAAVILGIMAFMFLSNMSQNQNYRRNVDTIELVNYEFGSAVKQFISSHLLAKLESENCNLNSDDLDFELIDFSGYANHQYKTVFIDPWTEGPSKWYDEDKRFRSYCRNSNGDPTPVNPGGPGDYHMCIVVSNLRSLAKGQSGKSDLTSVDISQAPHRRLYARIDLRFKSLLDSRDEGRSYSCRNFISRYAGPVQLEAMAKFLWVSKVGSQIKTFEKSQTFVFNNGFLNGEL